MKKRIIILSLCFLTSNVTFGDDGKTFRINMDAKVALSDQSYAVGFDFTTEFASKTSTFDRNVELYSANPRLSNPDVNGGGTSIWEVKRYPEKGTTWETGDGIFDSPIKTKKFQFSVSTFDLNQENSGLITVTYHPKAGGRGRKLNSISRYIDVNYLNLHVDSDSNASLGGHRAPDKDSREEDRMEIYSSTKPFFIIGLNDDRDQVRDVQQRTDHQHRDEHGDAQHVGC